MKYTRIANYHTHTTRCNHAVGKDEEYVQAAIRNGIQILGFSDHMPWPPLAKEQQHVRMKVEEIEDYLSSIRSLKEKYKDQITILVGFEAEYYHSREGWLQEVKEKYGIDYYIFGAHYYELDSYDTYMGGIDYTDQKNLCRDYLHQMTMACESGLFSYLCHPDLFLKGYEEITEEMKDTVRKICELSIKYDLPLEYNLQGRRYKTREPLCYPRNEFWEIASEYPIKVVIGGDYHNPKDMDPDQFYEEAYDYLTSLGFTILDVVEIK